MKIALSGLPVSALLAILLLAGCDGSGGGTGTRGSASEEMFRLALMNGCIECHIDTAAKIGPSWNAISERYREAPLPDARAHLIRSVKEGSKGNWVTWKGVDGMPPLAGRVSDEHIEQLVDYILALKR